ncbi:ABC transporter C family member 10 [Dichanthelium oligosanthes]|uniref:ABC transporter C family member 10 n=1 Tax=Dichanthelium oligosanthes TaxID=888268 RepID=A0A1E5VH89_9POAL|nr:ABC transporter C family member 10 [Dichanthelium oligosanthes]
MRPGVRRRAWRDDASSDRSTPRSQPARSFFRLLLLLLEYCIKQPSACDNSFHLLGFWMMNFCGGPICSGRAAVSCAWKETFDSSTCLNHLLVTGIATLLVIILALQLFVRIPKRRASTGQLVALVSPLHLGAVVFNGCLGLVYLGLGLWMLGGSSFNQDAPVYLPHWWLLTLAQGFSLTLVSFAFSIRARILGEIFVWFWSIFLTIYAAYICSSAVVYMLVDKKVTMKACLDVLFLPGGLLLLVHGVWHIKDDGYEGTENALCKPLSTETAVGAVDSEGHVTPFAKAGFFSVMSFWWLNPLMKMGYEKLLEEKDLPLLGVTDRAYNQYLMLLEKLDSKKRLQPHGTPSVFWTIISCHKSGIMVSGFFALLKVLTLSSGPVLLKEFINVSLGKANFKYEGYVLAAALFVCKCCESLSERQWFFRARRIGLQVRSFLSAAIYKKQQRLSSSAKMKHSSGEIMNYVTVDAYRIGEFPYWFHQTWTTSVQLCIALAILYNAVGLAMIASLLVIIITVLCNAPLAKLQHKFQSKLMEAQDVRLKAMSESLIHMKILKLYAWETHFKKVIEGLREVEYKWLSAFQLRRGYNSLLFWSSPVLVSAATFLACYLLKIPLDASNVFTFVATLRLVQNPIRQIPEVIGVVIQAKVAFTRIAKFLDAPELNEQVRKKYHVGSEYPIEITSCSFSWNESPSKPTLKNINLVVRTGEKVAICGEVGSGKSTLLAAVLGEVPKTGGKNLIPIDSSLNLQIQVCGKIAYVSQNAWIQTGTLQDNILFGSSMDKQRYQDTLLKCSLVKDLELLPYGDHTQIGERGVNLSGGQKQRVQLARALYQNADIYLLDDPFSAVDAHTATSIFNEYVMGALSDKTVLLVTHQVDFLPVFDCILLMSDGEIIRSAPYQELLAHCQEFQGLVNAHKDTIGISDHNDVPPKRAKGIPTKEINDIHGSRYREPVKSSPVDQLIKREEREMGDTGLKPYMLYLCQKKGFLYGFLCVTSHMIFLAAQISQNSWMAANVQNPSVSTLKLISVYIAIGVCSVFFILSRTLSAIVLGIQTSRSLFSQLLNSLFRAPMSFFDSTPLGRVLSRVSSDLSIIDLDVPMVFMFTSSASLNAYSNLGVLAVVTWQVLFVSVPMIVLAIALQRYYLASAKELMRINGTTKSALANHLGESIFGAVTIRAFEEEDSFFAKNLELVDKNAGPFFYNFAATEWLIQRLETMSAVVLSFSAFVMALLPTGTFSPGFVGMALSYGLSLNVSFVNSIQRQCSLANQIISVERVNQYMDVPSEGAEVIEGNRPGPDWPQVGRVELEDLKIRYRQDSPLVLHGISCTFEGGHKIGIVGRTGSGKTTLIGALFRLVEPAGGTIIIDSVDITTIGLHDLRSRLGIIPQDPTLFQGTVRYNLDPLGQFSDQQILEVRCLIVYKVIHFFPFSPYSVLDKCQLIEAVQEKEHGLDSMVLDEATASIDNATDAILQKTIRTEFKDSTVITIAHRIPTVMDCNMVLVMSDGYISIAHTKFNLLPGKVVEYDKPMKLMESEGSLFRELVKEYWSYASSGNI